MARAVSDGIYVSVTDGFDDALGLTIEVEPSGLPALEPPEESRPKAAKKSPARNDRKTAKKATAAK